MNNSPFFRLVASCTTIAFVLAIAPPSALAQPTASQSTASQSEVRTTSAEIQTTSATTESTLSPEEEEAKRTQARAAFDAGNAAFEAEDFVTAEAEFRKAHSILPSPHAEYWIARSVDLQNKDAKDIVAHYESFLALPGASHVGAERVAEAEARVLDLKKTLPATYVFVTDPAGARILIDGILQEGVTPYQVELKPGTHQIEVQLEGYENNSVELQVEGGTQVEQPISLIAAAPAEAAEEPVATGLLEQDTNSKVPAYVTLGLGGAGLIAGTIFGILALNGKSDFDKSPSQDKADEVERNALISDMSFGVALTLGITGIVLLTASDSPKETAKKTKPGQLIVAPFASPTSGGAAARMTF